MVSAMSFRSLTRKNRSFPVAMLGCRRKFLMPTLKNVPIPGGKIYLGYFYHHKKLYRVKFTVTVIFNPGRTSGSYNHPLHRIRIISIDIETHHKFSGPDSQYNIYPAQPVRRKMCPSISAVYPLRNRLI